MLYLPPTSSSSSHKYNTLKQLPIIYSVFILRHHYQHSSCEVFWIQCTYHMSQTWTGCKNNPFNGVNISCQVPAIPTTYTCTVTHCWHTHSRICSHPNKISTYTQRFTLIHSFNITYAFNSHTIWMRTQMYIYVYMYVTGKHNGPNGDKSHYNNITINEWDQRNKKWKSLHNAH